MANAVNLDITKQLNSFTKLQNDMPFIISKAMNDLAFEKGRKDLSEHMKDELETRVKLFSNPSSIRVKKSNKQNLEVELYHIKKELGLQMHTGIERPEGRKLAIPVRINMSRYAGIPADKPIPKSLQIDTILTKSPSVRNKTKIYKTRGVKPFVGKKGVYIRVGEGLRLLYVFADKAIHRKKLINFQKRLELTFNKNFDRYLERQYLRVLKG
jgi:hypothetical protein